MWDSLTSLKNWQLLLFILGAITLFFVCFCVCACVRRNREARAEREVLKHLPLVDIR